MISVTNKTTVEVATPLCVKELAAALGRHASFVYAMRGAGFRMQWNAEMRCEAATVTEAQNWLTVSGWRKK